ncbi:hypothetical protein [Fodinicurvata sp. EGI_FJ10296]|uniref:hypothetical protein n=1 Tax=Fodinicurvata sp. EGI_FJ10296 TaxID=3231908 RepID=UPI003455762B
MIPNATAMAAILSLLVAIPSYAEPVAINRGQGQGYAVEHRNNCYILLPAHVPGRGSALTLSAGAPPVVGEAYVFHRFAIDDMDLAVAFVRAGLQGRCSSTFADLPRRIDDLLGNARELSLVRVASGGIVSREPVEVTEILYETLRVRTAAETRDLSAGSSGSFLFSGDVPVAMLTDAVDRNNGIALRIDAIVSRVSRLLDGGPSLGDIDESPPAMQPPGAGGDGAIGFRVVACEPEPFDPDFACSRLEAEGGAVLMPAGQPVRIDMELTYPEGVIRSIRSVSVRSAAAGDDDHAVPKAIRIEIDSSAGGARRWRPFAAGDMSPLGEFDADQGVGQFAERVRLHITGSWSDHLERDLPIRLDRVTIR